MDDYYLEPLSYSMAYSSCSTSPSLSTCSTYRTIYSTNTCSRYSNTRPATCLGDSTNTYSTKFLRKSIETCPGWSSNPCSVYHSNICSTTRSKFTAKSCPESITNDSPSYTSNLGISLGNLVGITPKWIIVDRIIR